MAPRVPALVPNVTLRQDATPGLRLDAPAEAFGGASARAVGEEGRALEQVGDKIFARAVALQQLDNEAAARDATTEYILESGRIWEEYQTKQGKDAPQTYEQYQESLKAARENLRKGMTNPSAENMFDAQTQSIMARTILYGAGHAARENKKYLVTSAEARIAASGDEAMSHPKDERAFQAGVRNTRREVAGLAGIAGWDEERTTREQQVAESKLWANRITGLSRTDPESAAQLLEANRARLTADDLTRVDQRVRIESRAVGSARIAQEVFAAGQGTADKAPKTLAEMQAEAEAKAKAAFPDDPVMAKNAVSALQGIYNQQKYAARQENIENKQTVDEAIVTGVRNEQELLASPRVAAAFQALTPTQQLAVPGQINRYNAARDQVTNQDNYNRLYGLSNNNVIEFLNTDLTKEQLSQTDMQRLMKTQKQLKERSGGDPRVEQSMGWLRSARAQELEALGVYRRTAKNTDEYDKLTGALQQALEVWLETNKKPATYKDVVENIGPELIRKITEPRDWWFGNREVPRFQQAVPAAWSAQVQADLKARGLPEATPEQLQRAYTRSTFDQLYGKKPAAK